MTQIHPKLNHFSPLKPSEEFTVKKKKDLHKDASYPKPPGYLRARGKRERKKKKKRAGSNTSPKS